MCVWGGVPGAEDGDCEVKVAGERVKPIIVLGSNSMAGKEEKEGGRHGE